MTIKPLPQSIPTKLPPAKLYLDDITEIVQILTDSSAECQASFVAVAGRVQVRDGVSIGADSGLPARVQASADRLQEWLQSQAD